MSVFADRASYGEYLALLKRGAGRYGVQILAYCLMPNHVHLIAVPSSESGLARALQWVHSRFAEYANRRHEGAGHVWQQRFRSAPMDDVHLYWAARYVLQNPVRARLVERAVDWRWSSAAAHAGLRGDPVVEPAVLMHRVPDVLERLDRGDISAIQDEIRRSTRRGLPLGEDRFRARVLASLDADDRADLEPLAEAFGREEPGESGLGV
jgi:putative transposase